MNLFVLSAAFAAIHAEPEVIAGKFLAPSLGAEVRYELHLPPRHMADPGDVPVLYFLHGIGDDESSWDREGFAAIATAMMRRGEIPPLAVALLDGRRGFYTNAYDDGPREEDAVGDFVAFVEGRHLGPRERGQRAIAGISMGGYGALKIALKSPDRFAAAGSLSGALRQSADTKGFGPLKRWYLRRVFGPPGSPEMREANDVFTIIRSGQGSAAPALFVACGTEDRYGFHAGAEALAGEARDRGVPVVERITPGGHDNDYWRETMPALLRFVGERIGRTGPADAGGSLADMPSLGLLR